MEYQRELDASLDRHVFVLNLITSKQFVYLQLACAIDGVVLFLNKLGWINLIFVKFSCHSVLLFIMDHLYLHLYLHCITKLLQLQNCSSVLSRELSSSLLSTSSNHLPENCQPISCTPKCNVTNAMTNLQWLHN